MAVANSISITTLLLWGLGILSTNDAFLLEAVGFGIKWAIEWAFEDFKMDSWDLWVHHGSMTAGVLWLYFDPASRPYTSLTLHLNTVHIPLLFKWLRKLVPKYSAEHEFFDGCFHYLWPSAVFYRFGVAFWHIGFTALPRPFKVVCCFFPILDYLWTPWRRYGAGYRTIDSPSASKTCIPPTPERPRR